MNIQKHNRPISNSRIRNLKRQAGFTLIEAMISLALSLIVTAAMVALMANSLGTSTRVIHMSQLTDEMRNAMSMMTRDVRRANYSANSIYCYGNSACGYAGGVAEQVGDIQVTLDQSCFTFNLDRDFSGPVTNDPAGGFRLMAHPTILSAEDGLGVGVIQMWTGDASPGCGDGYAQAEWVELTDPGKVNITVFTVDDSGSFDRDIAESKTKTFNNRQRQIQITLEGQLTLEEDMVDAGALADTMVWRRMVDTIYVRNDFISPTI